ncbi:MAG: AbrB/MazE/SpoVT family DNA-binding domain-containing protein [Sphingobium sp.]|nr:AbrB/MazE/SpoVT family DNA-binding domain-containing protein [Sphingobium sp.]
MNGPVRTRTFKSGNSVAVRLPRALGVGPDETLAISRQGDVLTARRIPSAAEEAERLARFRTGLDALKKLPGPAAVEQRDPIEFPDRPGL